MDLGRYPFEYYKFGNDLKVFCYEMFHYIFARRFWYSKHPEPMPVTQHSEFTEEFGKAVLAIWHNFGKRIEKILEKDYPRYTCRIDNFERYVKLKVKDLLNDDENNKKDDTFTLIYRIIKMSAILFDTYVYCYKKKYDGFLPDFVEFWTGLFLSQFYDDFNKDRVMGWMYLREACLKFSKLYDEAKAEKFTHFEAIQVKLSYFNRNGTKGESEELYYSSKRVSRFHTVSKEFKKILPAQLSANIRKKEETLSIIYDPGKHKDVFELIGTEANKIPEGMSQIITDWVRSVLSAEPTKKAPVGTIEVVENKEKRRSFPSAEPTKKAAVGTVEVGENKEKQKSFQSAKPTEKAAVGTVEVGENKQKQKKKKKKKGKKK